MGETHIPNTSSLATAYRSLKSVPNRVALKNWACTYQSPRMKNGSKMDHLLVRLIIQGFIGEWREEDMPSGRQHLSTRFEEPIPSLNKRFNLSSMPGSIPHAARSKS